MQERHRDRHRLRRRRLRRLRRTATTAASASDCQSGVCTGGICQAPTCNDGVRNGSETDVDCGGTLPRLRAVHGHDRHAGARRLLDRVERRGHRPHDRRRPGRRRPHASTAPRSPLQPGGTFSTSLPLSAARGLQPDLRAARARTTTARPRYDRVVVIAGASIADGASSPNGVAHAHQRPRPRLDRAGRDDAGRHRPRDLRDAGHAGA